MSLENYFKNGWLKKEATHFLSGPGWNHPGMFSAVPD
jgi:hypothetical protein